MDILKNPPKNIIIIPIISILVIIFPILINLKVSTKGMVAMEVNLGPNTVISIIKEKQRSIPEYKTAFTVVFRTEFLSLE